MFLLLITPSVKVYAVSGSTVHVFNNDLKTNTLVDHFLENFEELIGRACKFYMRLIYSASY